MLFLLTLCIFFFNLVFVFLEFFFNVNLLQILSDDAVFSEIRYSLNVHRQRGELYVKV